MKWVWDGGFRAHKLNEDGTVTEMIFTSSAQARQHVEKAEGIVLTQKHISPRRANKNRIVGRANSTPLTRLNDEQAKLKADALKMMQGL